MKVIQIKRNTPLYIYICFVFKLELSILIVVEETKKKKNTPLIFDFFFYNEIDNSSLKTKHKIYMLSVLCLDACERYHVFTKKVHYQTTGRGVRCFESSASIKGIGIVESYGRR